MKSAFLLFTIMFSLNASADWGGVLSGDGKTLNSTYENCDMNVDFFLNRPNSTFEIAHIDYACALPTETLFQAFNDIRMTIEPNGQLMHNGAAVGHISDTTLEFTLQQGSGAQFKFEVVPGTAAWDAVIVDATHPEPISIRLW